jgi:hypothetical protein
MRYLLDYMTFVFRQADGFKTGIRQQKRQPMASEIEIRLKHIKSNQPDKDTILDEFFKIIPMNLGVINVGELLKKLLRFRKEGLVEV